MSSPTLASTEHVNRAPRRFDAGEALTPLFELFRYRSLIQALVYRHLSIRYRGSILGFLWSFLNPLCLMAIYTVVFHYYIRFHQVENYTIFLLCGLLPWIWSSSALHEGTSSIAGSGHLITKSMFPAHILPFVSVVTSLVNFLLSLPLLFLFMLFLGVPVPGTVLLLPVLLLVQLTFLHGCSLFLGSANVMFRDVQHLVGNFLSFVFFLCPVVYPLSSVPKGFRFTINYNPFALFILAYQELLLEGRVPGITHMAVLLIWSIGALVCGYVVFNRWREHFAEML
jgi:lipopolysaccharide transport system permease protein